jgi:hypothetical protein
MASSVYIVHVYTQMPILNFNLKCSQLGCNCKRDNQESSSSENHISKVGLLCLESGPIVNCNID